MKPEVMKQQYVQFRQAVTGLFASLLELSAEAGGDELAALARGLLAGVGSPFLFVVVGEVKAGKSSFINALVGEPICAVAPDPCTDVIQKIVYAQERSNKMVSAHVREVGIPSDILKEIAIVDTPGTNSIIEHHQEITEGFIPESDLVIFVFPALNPYSKTAWDFFGFVHQRWHKKIIFVLQQADRASPEELRVNLARVTEYAQARGLENPRIFTVSAKLALAGDAQSMAASGMDAVWDYIRDTVTGGRHYLLKMESLLSTAGDILSRADAALGVHGQAVSQDRAEQARIEATLARGKEYALRDVGLLKARLLEAYTRNAAETVQEFEDGLSIGNLVRNSFSGLFKRSVNSLRDWVESLTLRFNERFGREVDAISRQEAARIIDNLTALMENLLGELRGEARRPGAINIPALTRRRLEVVGESIENVQRLLRDEALSDRLRPQGLSKMGEQAMMGGFLTAVGAVIAATAHAVVFDVTGGIAATAGALLAINTLAFKRRSVVKRFREGFEEGRERFEKELADKLGAQMEVVFRDISQAFEPFFADIHDRSARLETLLARAADLRGRLDQERRDVERLTGEAAETPQ